MSSRNQESMGSIIRTQEDVVRSSASSGSLFARLKRLHKQQKRFTPYWVTGILTLLMVGYFYTSSSLSELNRILFEGNVFLSKGTVLALTGLSGEDEILSLRPSKLERQIETHPLVKEATVSLKGLNDLKIQVEEEQVLGCVASGQNVDLLLSNGILVNQSSIGGQPCHGVFFYDMESLPEEMNLLYLTTALNQLSPDFLALIDAVYYEPELGDIYRFSIHLKDGNVVKVNTYTMANKLKYYPDLLKKVHATYGVVTGTFFLDVGDRFVVHEGLLEEAMMFYEERGSLMKE